MSSVFDKLVGKQLITDYPKFLKHNIHYEAVVGSVAYGVSGNLSDYDVYGFCMPPKHILFPYQHGNIFGFGKQPEVFNQYQNHHIMDGEKEYDLSIFNIVRYFQLCLESNPNMVDSLFVPRNCVLHCTEMGEYVRENRKLFLSKLCWHKYRGYAYSQLSKMNDKVSKTFVELCENNGWSLDITWDEAKEDVGEDEWVRNVFKKVDQSGHRSKRLGMIQTYGYDIKFAYNVVRLLEETHQILEEGDLDLQRNKEILKSIRKGEWPQEKVQEYFDNKYPVLEKAYENSKLPHNPRETEIKNLLVECIQMCYGSDIFEKSVVVDTSIKQDIWKVKDIIDQMVKTLE
jgi:hypothetical protein